MDGLGWAKKCSHAGWSFVSFSFVNISGAIGLEEQDDISIEAVLIESVVGHFCCWEFSSEELVFEVDFDSESNGSCDGGADELECEDDDVDDESCDGNDWYGRGSNARGELLCDI